MLMIFGLLFTCVMVLGAYMLGGGNLQVILAALPMEIGIIGGSAVGSFLVANKMHVIKSTLKDILISFKGNQYKRKDYEAVLLLLYDITKRAKTKGVLTLEAHVENPRGSAIFKSYPSVLTNSRILELICDTFRVISLNVDNPMQIEEVIDKKIRKIEHELLASSHALQVVADGLPALGIVAAVLGVIKTMASIDQPPPVLGKMIGGALVGTFLGVFLAYCVASPLANKIKSIYEQDMHLYFVVRDVIISYLYGNSPQVAVEMGRANIPTEYQPSFVELEKQLQKESE
ncbi:MAG: flagellar motor stator protein MotA [Candidatus Midichloria sp.]|nr:flagellar motor stator protein MotA [Candidatus Midichloria sp.]